MYCSGCARARARAAATLRTLRCGAGARSTVADATEQLVDHPKLKEHLQALGELERTAVAVRRFVGTNVIAATKIV
eukprot:COSAG02_NODE_54542_length_295_cov_1.142857_1_plen_75_part_01